mmetsp:Transcript_40328/g.99630  ORF Transcript_40328/g.99630 Transcript_40328/m.99630 type:complete len:207 (-) Transcript_40328:106-726(-)
MPANCAKRPRCASRRAAAGSEAKANSPTTSSAQVRTAADLLPRSNCKAVTPMPHSTSASASSPDSAATAHATAHACCETKSTSASIIDCSIGRWPSSRMHSQAAAGSSCASRASAADTRGCWQAVECSARKSSSPTLCCRSEPLPSSSFFACARDAFGVRSEAGARNTRTHSRPPPPPLPPLLGWAARTWRAWRAWIAAALLLAAL